MSISKDELTTLYVKVDLGATVQNVRNEIGENLDINIVATNDSDFYLFRWTHLLQVMQAKYPNDMAVQASRVTLKSMPDFLAAHTAKTVQLNDPKMTLRKAKKEASGQHDHQFNGVVVVEVGQFDMLTAVGVVLTGAAENARSADKRNGDAIPATGGQMGRLGESDVVVESKETEPRIINVELRDEDYIKLKPAKEPLKLDLVYSLFFFVDSTASADSVIEKAIDLNKDGKLFAPSEDEVVLDVQLESEDFKITDNKQKMTVPRTGRSDDLIFEFEALKEGRGTIQALFFKDGVFVQVISLQFFVGDLFKSETQGRDLAQASLLKPSDRRDLNLTILEAVGGYQMVMSGPTAAIATIPITQAQLHAMIKKIRDILFSVVHFEAGEMPIYQRRIDIPAGVNKHILPILANAGYDFFDQLFYGPGHSLQANKLGDTFKKMALDGKLRIQIFATQFTLPWGLLYVGDDPDNPNPDHFLGMKHVIEYIPLQPKMQVTERVIDTSDGLTVGLHVNSDIDVQMGSAIIGRQLDVWDAWAKGNDQIKVEIRKQAYEVVDALGGEKADEVMYFYCHAESYDLNDEDKGGYDESKLVMTSNKALTLKKLRRKKESLPGNPLVFINACESTKMSPQFYDGFVPYFMSKGARGVIGTEVETPALFAEEWANRFFTRFLKGEQNIGDIFLDLRQEFYNDSNNVMGLLYALYVDGNTYVSDRMLND